MTEKQFEKFMQNHWDIVRAEVGRLPGISWDFKWHPHFSKKRGYGVTYPENRSMSYARKILKAPKARVEGIVRHELGHIVDSFVDPDWLNEWAQQRGTELPSTQEKRADSIAEEIWNEPIYYDEKLFVQNTKAGIRPRPQYLGE